MRDSRQFIHKAKRKRVVAVTGESHKGKQVRNTETFNLDKATIHGKFRIMPQTYEKCENAQFS